jgi:WD40 repeat protein
MSRPNMPTPNQSLTPSESLANFTNRTKKLPVHFSVWVGLMIKPFLLSLVFIVNLACTHSLNGGGKEKIEKPRATWCVAFSPDGKHLAASRGYYQFLGRPPWGGEGEVCVWQTRDWKVVELEAPAFSNNPEGIVFSKDGKELFTCADAYFRNGRGNPMNGSEVFTWSWPDGKLKNRYHNKEHGPGATGVEIHPNANLIAVPRSGGPPLLFSRENDGAVIELDGHTGNSLSLSFQPDGRSLVSATHIGARLRLYDPATGKEIATLSPKDIEPTSLKHSADGKQIAVGCKDGSLRLIDDKLTKELWASIDAKRKDRIRSVAFTPDGKTIAAASGEEVWLCDAKDGSTKLTLKAELRVMSVAISPDGKMLAAGLSDAKLEHGCVKVWDVATGKLIKTLE